MVFLIKSLASDRAFVWLFGTEGVIDTSIWVNPHEFVSQFAVADFAHAVVSDHEI